MTPLTPDNDPKEAPHVEVSSSKLFRELPGNYRLLRETHILKPVGGKKHTVEAFILSGPGAVEGINLSKLVLESGDKTISIELENGVTVNISPVDDVSPTESDTGKVFRISFAPPDGKQIELPKDLAFGEGIPSINSKRLLTSFYTPKGERNTTIEDFSALKLKATLDKLFQAASALHSLALQESKQGEFESTLDGVKFRFTSFAWYACIEDDDSYRTLQIQALSHEDGLPHFIYVDRASEGLVVETKMKKLVKALITAHKEDNLSSLVRGL